MQIFSDLLLKSSALLPDQAKDLTPIMHFICNLHNHKLQHYVLGKNTNSVQNAITLAQKKDAELCIIKGWNNHDPEHEIIQISNKYQSKSSSPGPYHDCSGPYLIRECKDLVCKGCKPNLDNHAPAQCQNKKTCQTVFD